MYSAVAAAAPGTGSRVLATAANGPSGIVRILSVLRNVYLCKTLALFTRNHF